MFCFAAVADVTPFEQDNGVYGQPARDGHLSFDLAVPNGRRLLALLDAARTDRRPYDVVLGQMWSGYIDVGALERAKQLYGVLTVTVGMDDRHAFRIRKLGRELGTCGLAGTVDFVLTAAPEAVGWFLAEGCAASFWPEASDPALFRPIPELGKDIDVCFVGARYGVRKRLVRRLEAAGVRVVARGVGWPHGRIPIGEVPTLFVRSKIVLGVGTVGHSETLLALKLRDFDGPMSGSCYVTHDNSDLGLVYDVGNEIEVYEEGADCVRVVTELLADDGRCERIATAGRRRAAAEDTWEQRFQELFGILRGAEPRS